MLPRYANTHTESSGTGLQTTRLREDARQIIHDAVGGDDETCVIFCGSGATGAIDKLIGIMNLRIPADLDDRYDLSQHIPPNERPIVFVGPFEHHSNELPWRESIADVITIPEDADGHIDLADSSRAHRDADRTLKIGSFSAASNVTGIVSNTCAIADMLHNHGALSFWDFAAAGPYVDIEMYPQCPEHPLAYKDAVFLSPHKFVGGPGTPGVLVVAAVAAAQPCARRRGWRHGGLRQPDRAPLPRRPGPSRGGRHAGDRRIDPRRSGLPAEAGRRRRDHQGARGVVLAPRRRGLVGEPGDQVLGNTRSDRLSILSFVVRRPGGRYLHHNFVVALLSDLFGIQSRGGCSCAGPYGHRLLGIDIERSHEFEHEITEGCEGIKPGWTRVSFNYFISETVFKYLVDAVDLVAEHGWKLLPEYRFNAANGAVAPSRRAGRAAAAAVAALLRPDHRRAAAPASRPSCAHPRSRSPATSTPPGERFAAATAWTDTARTRERCRPRSRTCAGSTFPPNHSPPSDSDTAPIARPNWATLPVIVRSVVTVTFVRVVADRARAGR